MESRILDWTAMLPWIQVVGGSNATRRGGLMGGEEVWSPRESGDVDMVPQTYRFWTAEV